MSQPSVYPFKDALWGNNVVFAHLLSLCPAMAITTSATNGLGMGLATTMVMVCSNLLVALLRGVITPQVRISVYVIIIATLVTAVEMAMNAWLHPLYKVLGLFIPLIVVNCSVFSRVESFASKNNLSASVMDGLAMGLGFTWAVTLLGGVRELVGSGTLFAQASLMLGPAFAGLEVTVIPQYRGFLVALLPPGAFLGLGMLVALKRVADTRLRSAANAAAPSAAQGHSPGHAH